MYCRFPARTIFVCLLLVLICPPAAAESSDDSASETGEASRLQFDDPERFRIESSRGVVAADERRASEVGASILEDGGNAADAAAAAMLTLGVTNPQSSGLGGGGFCLVKEAGDDEPAVLDFRETAPGEAHRDLYIEDGEAQSEKARKGGLAVATPAEPAGVWALQGRFGRLDWESIVDPAHRLAADGFEIGPNLGNRIQRYTDELGERPELAAVFQNDDGDWLTEGDKLVRPGLAESLRVLRDQGYRPFYHGDIAEAIAETTRDRGGILTADDLADYRVEQRDAIEGRVADHRVYSMPPPSSGGIALIQAFNILDDFETADSLQDPAYMHLVVESLKHAFADRARWLGDTDHVDVPVDRLLSEDYLRERADQIDPESVLPTDEYGTVPPDQQGAGTAHLSVIDGDDNMVACTNTINTSFGSMVFVPEYGLVLNNEMADFNIEPGEPNIYGLIGTEQNAVAADKRPLSSMSPTLVTTDRGGPVMSLGASGGPMIISGVYFTLLRTLMFDATPLEAMVAPRLHHQWVPDVLRAETEGLPYLEGLRQRGHEVEVDRIYSAVQLIMREGDDWIGVTDPRKGGIPDAPEPETGDE